MKIADKFSRLALGTAQFGLNYGVANQRGKIPPHEISQILDHALRVGVTTLDTAIAYGDSETVLGHQNLGNFSVITKLPEVPVGCSDIGGWVESQLLGSLGRLGVDSVDGLLLHRPGQLLETQGKNLYDALSRLRDQRLVSRIGISIYDPEELHALCGRYHFDLLQAPFNVLDMRLLTSGWLSRLQNYGTAVHVRSIFLQGLLLFSRSDRPAKFARWSTLWDQWDTWLTDTGQTPVQACLRHVLTIPQIERVVLGVDSFVQWKDILQSAAGAPIPLPQGLGCTDIELLNPSLWNHL